MTYSDAFMELLGGAFHPAVKVDDSDDSRDALRYGFSALQQYLQELTQPPPTPTPDHLTQRHRSGACSACQDTLGHRVARLKRGAQVLMLCEDCYGDLASYVASWGATMEASRGRIVAWLRMVGAI